MTVGEISVIIAGVGTVAGAVLKGLNELQKTIWKGKERAEKLKADAEEVVKAEKQTSYDNLKRDFDALVAKVEALQAREHRVEKQLVKARAWIKHLEAALENSQIPYVPYTESDDGENDSPAPRTKSNPPINLRPKRQPKKGEDA